MIPEDIILKILFFFPVFLFSLTVHEYAHAITANWGGDLTSTYQDRLTLNPIHHIDLFGSIIIPLVMLSMAGGAFFGWARPVPVNEANFRDKAWNVLVSFAGPFSNFLIIMFGGFFFSLVTHFYSYGVDQAWWAVNEALVIGFFKFVNFYIFLNVLLLFFNLLPIPPLDGSHIFYHFFIRGRGRFYEAWDFYQRFGIIFMFLIVMITPFFQMLAVIYVFIRAIFNFPSDIGGVSTLNLFSMFG